MKVIIIKNNFKKGLDAVTKISNEKINLPILKNVLLVAEDTTLKLSATNLEMGVTFYCSAKIIEPGKVTVPAALLSSLINNLTSEVVSLTLEGSNFFIKTDNYEASIQTLPPEDFPIIPSLSEEEGGIEFSIPFIKEAFQQVLAATQFSDLRPEINGILFVFSDNKIKLVGTDSFRLAERVILTSDFSTSVSLDIQAIIPLQTIQDFIRISNESGRVSLFFNSNQILFKTEEFIIISRLIEGIFPHYEPIIPKTTEAEAIISSEELLNALRVTSVLSSKIHDVTLSLKNQGVVTIFSTQQGIGANTYTLPIIIKGGEMDVTFNSNYLM